MTDHARPASFGTRDSLGNYVFPEMPQPITQRPDVPRSLDPEGLVGVAFAQAKRELYELAEIAGAAVHDRNCARIERDKLREDNERLRYALSLASDTLENAQADLRQRIAAGRQIREILRRG